MKTRLLGAAVLIALLVLFVPMFFPSSPPSAPGDQSVSLAIPPAPDRDLQTRTMSLNPDATAPAPPASAGATVIPTASSAGGDRLATVDIHAHPAAGGDAGTASSVATMNVTPATGGPVIEQAPPTPKASAPATPPKTPPAPTPAKPDKPAPTPALPAATAARGHFTLNLSAYGSASGAASLVQKVRALGYPVSSHAIHQGGKTLTAVEAGPFPTRTAAESARLKITQTIAGVPARIESDASTPAGDEPAAKPATKPATAVGGWAVQVAAMSGKADALALRDKLRANGFDGFVDSVVAGGRTLWRVRVGPQTQRDDALRVREQIQSRLGLSGNVVSVP